MKPKRSVRAVFAGIGVTIVLGLLALWLGLALARRHGQDPKSTATGRQESPASETPRYGGEPPPSALAQPIDMGAGSPDVGGGALGGHTQAAAGRDNSEVELVPPEVARRVAIRHAASRWEGCQVGDWLLAYAPDGRPEVYFFLVFKDGVPSMPLDGVRQRVSALRQRRVELERRQQGEGTEPDNDTSSDVRGLWREMRGVDTYGTVVVGANEGREPFIASFGGLPPQVFLVEDAMQVAAAESHTDQQIGPQVIWCPPLFIFFKFAGGPGGRTLFLQAQGSNLREASLSEWKRPAVPEEVIRRRRARWAAEKETAGD